MEPTKAEVADARMAMYARIIRCPLEITPEDCPLKEIRKMPMEERVIWIESKSDREIVELFQHHVKCLKENLSGSAE